MVFFAGRVPNANGPATRCEPRNVLFRNQQHRFEIQSGKSRRCGNTRSLRTALLSGAHGFSHRLGSAGIHDGGNVAQDVPFLWRSSMASGPANLLLGGSFTLIDATFEDQREAAIREHEAGLTLIRPQFKECAHCDFHRSAILRRNFG